MKVHVVVPARYASTRLPGKPLADIGGAPMIVRVMQRVEQANVDSVVAAVDHPDVMNALEAAGCSGMMTALDHVSGSDRVMEIAARHAWPDDDIVINVQGDEPLLPPQVVDLLAATMRGGAGSGVQMATVCERIQRFEDFINPNVVKVVVDRHGDALYFSRAPVPYPRDDMLPDGQPIDLHDVPARRHVGLYAFTVSALRAFTAIADAALENVERLEQLRWLEAGHKLRVVESPVPVPGGVDTPEDLARVVAAFGAG